MLSSQTLIHPLTLGLIKRKLTFPTFKIMTSHVNTIPTPKYSDSLTTTIFRINYFKDME